MFGSLAAGCCFFGVSLIALHFVLGLPLVLWVLGHWSGWPSDVL